MRYYETAHQERIGYDFYCDIAQQIVKARKEKEWSAETLAKESGMSVGKIARIESVQIKIKLDDIEKLAECLDVTVNWLIEAEIDSQIGDCLYLVWSEKFPDFKLYQRSTSKRLAYLQLEQRVNKAGVRFSGPRERAIVKLVGVPITDEEIRDRFPKLTSEEEPILPDTQRKEATQ